MDRKCQEVMLVGNAFRFNQNFTGKSHVCRKYKLSDL